MYIAYRFREFMKDPSDLDLWADTSQVARTIQEWKTNAEALHGTFPPSWMVFSVLTAQP